MKTQFLKSKLSLAIIFLAGLAIAISCKKSNTGNEDQTDQTQLTKN